MTLGGTVSSAARKAWYFATAAAILSVAVPLLIIRVAFAQALLYASAWWRERRRGRASRAVRPNTADAVALEAAFKASVDHPSLCMSASKLAEALRRGEWTAQEVVLAYLHHARRTNVVTNAISNERVEDALAEARLADAVLEAARERGDAALRELPPFLGVPCTLKEVFACAGMRQSAGVYDRRHYVATEDASTVARMKSAGFIPIVNTNVSEGCMWYESDNMVYGRTNNAYDPYRIVGGSSGGEACMVASACTVGIGSDIGGSIRMPCAFNGVFGHKPTGGLIPNTGQYPTTYKRFMVTGPICRYIDDLLPLVELLRGPDGVDPSCIDMSLTDVNLPSAAMVLRERAEACGLLAAELKHGRAVDGGSGSGSNNIIKLCGAVTPTSVTSTATSDTEQSPLHVRTGSGSSGTSHHAHHRRIPSSSFLSTSTPVPASMSSEDEKDALIHLMASPRSLASERSSTSESMSAYSDAVPEYNYIPRPPVTAWRDVTIWLPSRLHLFGPLLANAVQPSIHDAMERAADALVMRLGCRGVRRMELPSLAYAFDMWCAVLTTSGQPTFKQVLSEGYEGVFDAPMELLRWCFGRSRSTLPAIILAIIEDLPALLTPARLPRLAAECHVLRQKIFDALAASNGVLLFPVHPITAPLHGEPVLKPFNVAYTQLFNVLETPCTCVPMGLDHKGVPVGLQVVGAHGYDRLTLAVAKALADLGEAGWIAPPPAPRLATTSTTATTIGAQ